MQKGSVNKVVLVGHLGGDPETRFTASGAAVANFNLATNESWRDANSEIQDKTEWHRCVMFGKSAELGGNLLKKGQLVYVEGKLQTRNWEDKDGVKRYTTEVLCEMFTMLGRKMDNDGAAQQAKPETSNDSKNNNDSIDNDDDDDDLPF
jgi:single-strand DNA-binding protein|tara:strand:- start:180 stop:626 length:447 start_codon:yes stop_codon:yes gene_type:complete